MPQILTFLGQPRRQCAIASIGIARSLAQQGAKVLWMTQDSGPLPALLWGSSLAPEVQSVGSNLWTLQLQATVMLEKSWEVIKTLEGQYLRSPLLKQVFGQELVVLPGMDDALALNAIRELYDSAAYDYLVVDSPSSQSALRMWGLPENLDWYIRRFQKVLQASELAQTLSPFIQPVASAILNISGNQASLDQPLQQARAVLDAGRSAVQSPHQVLGFLVTTDGSPDIEMARYLWGSSQQIGLTVGGVMAFLQGAKALPEASFAPLSVHSIPDLQGENWHPLVAAAPSIESSIQDAPAPVMINEVKKQVRLFLPGFTKEEIGLTQYGPEVTVTAGDQRRNLLLPDTLKHRSVQGAKFQEDYLILSF
ncbi:MAG: ArsA family ATPase [Leptolyngbya sp. SIO1E4]|nr:ArsA family ATPase [Leptolyngbya sp. SIO1E4]